MLDRRHPNRNPAIEWQRLSLKFHVDETKNEIHVFSVKMGKEEIKEVKKE